MVMPAVEAGLQHGTQPLKKLIPRRKPTCFVIMPFSETVHGVAGAETRITKRQWDYIYTHWIKKAVEAFRPTRYKCKRSSAAPGNFIKGIIGDLADADLVIADLTGGKRNV